MTSTPDPNWPRRIAVLGVGLLGGSVALAIRRQRPNVVVAGTARAEQKCGQLVAAGIVDRATTSIEDACRDADVVVVAAPVDRIAAMIVRAAAAVPDHCLITDVGSTKAQIVADVAAHPAAAPRFVAAHPIAGSEKTGFAHATVNLFDGKPIIVTPHEANEPGQVERAQQFWRLTGGEIHTMSAAQHDTHLAAISHVPHLVAALVARMATAEARPLAGSGWQDITRVAAGDPTLWTAICSQNRTAILRELDQLSHQLDRLRETLNESDEATFRWLAEAKQIRDQS